MNDFFASSATVGVVISLLAYQIGLIINKKTKNAMFNPLLISIILVIGFLFVFDVEYNNYQQSAKYLSYLLTPATVSLAIPLYEKIDLLKKHVWAVLIGITAGVVTSLFSILGMAMIFQLSHQEYVTLLPKSITTAIGLGISEEFGGYVSITASAIIITGIFGNMIGPTICKIFGIKYAVSRGLAIGTSSHAVGTTKAMEMGEVEGAMSSLSIVVAGLLTVILASVFAMLY